MAPRRAATLSTVPTASSEYEPRRAQTTVLYQSVGAELESFLARARERGQPAPRFVEQELRAYLRCGVPAYGFLRLRCDDCRSERLVPFSCKRRGFCPSCGGRRMADTAANLVDRVLPEVPIRQWVLTLPYPLRYRCAYDAGLTSDVLQAFIRALFAESRRRVRREAGERADQCGAVTFIQRFGSAMNLNLHFHTLALDGAYVYESRANRPPPFIELAPPTSDDVARVLAGTARRLQRLILARAAEDDDALGRNEPLLALLAEASLRTLIATGPQAGQRWRRLGDRVEPDAAQPSQGGRDEDAPIARHAEMSLHAVVCVPARDRRRLERLCRYVARPPIANDRLEERPDGRLALRLKSRWRDGTTHILMERRDLLERIVPLIPPPRAHQVRYHGILAPAASLRDRVVPKTEPVADGAPPEPETAEHRAHPRRSRMRWAMLLARVFEIDALRCPECGSTLRLLAAIEDEAIASAILESLHLPPRAPPLAPARPEPSQSHPNLDDTFDFDQTLQYADS